jgi:hypothetical protein
MGRRLWETLVDRICRSLRNQFEVVRHGRVLLSIPVLVLVVLVVAAFWAVVPLAVVGLVFGCRCHFSGADLGINRVMDSATQTTEESKRSAKNNLGRD